MALENVKEILKYFGSTFYKGGKYNINIIYEDTYQKKKNKKTKFT
jgi:hypothetical protein